ncbi:hypothetical protein [Polaromonas jejuensis]|uniref:Uncharacterized protein n=1 Tax=Polaromonas jejuensis TaxID=457502 RepID=A0ABW0QFT1_9BURK|nr:hypothetical protein [Polaromonas jejuensis]
MDLPAALDPVLGARLLDLLRTAAPGSEAGTGMLRAALEDPAVHTVVLALTLGDEPVASLVQVTHASDSLGRWKDLSCI